MALTKKTLDSNVEVKVFGREQRYFQSCVLYYNFLYNQPSFLRNVVSIFAKKRAALIDAAVASTFSLEEVMFEMDDNEKMNGARAGHLINESRKGEPVTALVMLGTHSLGKQDRGVLVNVYDAHGKELVKFVTTCFENNEPWSESIIKFGNHYKG